MSKIYLDTETLGLCGPAILIQWSNDEGETVNLHEVFREPISETLSLIEKIATNEDGIVGFNLSFDWYQLCKLYTMFSLYHNYSKYPEDIIDELVELEPLARDENCLKPVKCCDLMLVARKGVYQSTMGREDIRIRRVPTALAWQLAAELEKRVQLSDIYFAKKANKLDTHFKVHDIRDSDGDVIADFKDIVLKFAPSSALKALVADALKVPVDDILLFADVGIDKKFMPIEQPFAPFAKAINKEGTWPDVIQFHISHWAYNQLARRYAEKDVTYLPQLYQFFGSPELGDDDSELACMVGAVRWRGFKIDIEGIRELRQKAIQKSAQIPKAPEAVRRYINQVINEVERVALHGSTKKVLLEEIATWVDPCPECQSDCQVQIKEPSDEEDQELWEDYEEFDYESTSNVTTVTCTKCGGKKTIPHPAALRAQEVLDARAATKEIELYDKLIMAGRLHADLNIIGAKSSRMSGAGKLNAQGIKRTKYVRSKFPLAWPGQILCGGDFEGFEITLADAEYNDTELRRDLLSGKKIHGLFGVFLYPGNTYEDILRSANTPNDMYTPSKSGVFALIYFGNHMTLHNRLGIPVDVAEEAYNRFCKRYPGIAIARQKVINAFQTMRQREQYGRIEWSEPAEYIESMLGFRRYFTVEHQIERALFELASAPPKEWRKLTNIRVYRKDREQSAMGAVQSALFGAAFAIQGANTRAAGNHRIQSSGAQITKKVQRNIWDLQPAGYHPWIVQPFNSHDEIMCPTHPDYTQQVKQIVDQTVESFRPKIPLIKMEWKTGIVNWGEK